MIIHYLITATLFPAGPALPLQGPTPPPHLSFFFCLISFLFPKLIRLSDKQAHPVVPVRPEEEKYWWDRAPTCLLSGVMGRGRGRNVFGWILGG